MTKTLVQRRGWGDDVKSFLASGSQAIAATGHRPDKLGGYNRVARANLVGVALKHLRELSGEPGRLRGISGMALGWDQAFAMACAELGIPFVAAIPFHGQELTWPKESRDLFQVILDHAALVHYVCEPGYAAWKMQRRNEWMVDHCDSVLAAWDGTEGGTSNCLRYARSRHRPIQNCYGTWKSGGRP